MLTNAEQYINNLRHALLNIDEETYQIDKIIVSPFLLEALDGCKNLNNSQKETPPATLWGHPVEVDFTFIKPYEIKIQRKKSKTL